MPVARVMSAKFKTLSFQSYSVVLYSVLTLFRVFQYPLYIKLAFLKALTITKDFTDNTDKRRSRIEAAQNCAVK